MNLMTSLKNVFAIRPHGFRVIFPNLLSGLHAAAARLLCVNDPRSF
jgi:hypothetical protein